MKAYKLFRQMSDGSLSPLFINKKLRVPLGVWLDAEMHATYGFAVRKGWHCTLEKSAPHLKMNPKGDRPRVWAEVEVEDYRVKEMTQGTWVLAQRMKVNKIC